MTPANDKATFDLQQLSPADLKTCAEALRTGAKGLRSRQDVAQSVVTFFHDRFRSVVASTDSTACVLVRCFQTSTFSALPVDYQHAAERLLDDVNSSDPHMRCLALLATRGSRSVWNEVATSTGHQAIPLPSVEVVRRAPMIARLLEELDLPVEEVVAPSASEAFLLKAQRDTSSIFHVADAAGSPFIPAQDKFVAPFQVRSVIGMGGLLSGGDVFAVILFTKVSVSREEAEAFTTLASTIRELLQRFGPNEVFRRSE